MNPPEILYSLDDGIGTITLNRPQARNALTFFMYEEIGRICGNPERYGNPRVLILTGAGEKAFGAGTDISQFRDFKTPQDSLDYEVTIERILTTIETSPVPTIAAISGAVTGGGAAIACCCDLRIATQSARFGFPIAKTLGNCLSVKNYGRLVNLLGPARVKELIFTARLFDADEGKSAGLFAEIVVDHAALMARARALAEVMSGHAPLTMRATKEALRRIAAARMDEIESEDIVQMCYLSADFREGMDAFLTKRAPNWQGK